MEAHSAEVWRQEFVPGMCVVSPQVVSWKTSVQKQVNCRMCTGYVQINKMAVHGKVCWEVGGVWGRACPSRMGIRRRGEAGGRECEVGSVRGRVGRQAGEGKKAGVW